MLETIKDIYLNLHFYELILLIFFCFLYIIRIIFVTLFYGKLLFVKNDFSEPREPLSLILTFRNEESDLKNNLPAILSIRDAEFEVIAVDDFSVDNSLAVLGTMKEKYSRLRYSSLSQETWFSVKMAQNIAIKAARYEWIMVISPSVREFDPGWLSLFSSAIDSRSELIIGYSNIKNDGTFYNFLYRTELFMQQLRSFGFILNGLPYILSEENVVFKKENYFSEGGYRQKVKEPYANLELLINSFIKKKSTKIIFSSEAKEIRSESISRLNFYDLLKKEIRIMKYLSPGRRLLINIEEISECFFLPSAVLLYLCIPYIWPVLTALVILLATSRMFIIKKALRRLNERKIFLTSFVYVLLLPCYKLIYRLYYNRSRRRLRWKSKK